MMPNALDPIAIAPPLRSVGPPQPKPTPFEAAGFIGLLTAALSSLLTDDASSGSMASDGEARDGERGQAEEPAADGGVLPALSDLPANAVRPEPAADEALPPNPSAACADETAAARREVEAFALTMGETDRALPAEEAPSPSLPPAPCGSDTDDSAPPPDPPQPTAMESPKEAATATPETLPGQPAKVSGPTECGLTDTIDNTEVGSDAAESSVIAGCGAAAPEPATLPAGSRGMALAVAEEGPEFRLAGQGVELADRAAAPRPVGKPPVEGQRRLGVPSQDRSEVSEATAPQRDVATNLEPDPAGSGTVSLPAGHDGKDEVPAREGLAGRPPHGLAEARSDTVARPATESPAASSPTAPTAPQPSLATGSPSPAVVVRGTTARAVVPPARQLAPVLITLALSSQDGPARLMLSLEPEELGRIEVAVERVTEGRLAITVVAERAETVLLLQRDSAVLDRALAQAGVGSEGRSLAFAFGGSGGRGGDRPGRPSSRDETARDAVAEAARPTSVHTLLDLAV